MKISIHQTLHGYLHGHQLLATSADLSIDEKKVLLFQSDLSGSSIYKGFETYISGYPIPNSKYYALGKTWYASEMPRPGCVWTQTLLIEFVDLGKIPELSSLLSFFNRPTINQFESYRSQIDLDFKSIFDGAISNPEIYNNISACVYENPQKTVLFIDNYPKKYEAEILNVWSDQWPRLRRNFSFCTGALSIRQLNGKEFDFQVLPKSLNLKLHDSKYFIYAADTDHINIPVWLDVVHKTSKNVLRKFLWSFGADIAGSRKNYTELIQLFTRIQLDNYSINSLANTIRDFLPSSNEGKSFKQSVFYPVENNTKFSEKEILKFLISDPDLEFLNIDDYNVSERILNQIKKGSISFRDFVDFWNLDQSGRISTTIWDKIDISIKDVLPIIEDNPHLLKIIIPKNLSLCAELPIWHTSYNTQVSILKLLKDIYPSEFPDLYLIAILQSKSIIAIDVLRFYGEKAVLTCMDWYLKPSNILTYEISEAILQNYRNEFIYWLKDKINNVPVKVYLLIFSHYNSQQIFNLPFSVSNWIFIFHSVKDNAYDQLPYVSTIALAIGFRNNLMNSENLVIRVFDDVFRFASRSKLNGLWDLIPKDLDGFDEEDDYNVFEAFIRLFGINPSKKRYQIPYWDHCELLIITYTHKFIKNNWSQQNFLDGLFSMQPFNRAIAYCITFKRGQEYLLSLKKNIENRKVKGRKFQVDVLEKFDAL